VCPLNYPNGKGMSINLWEFSKKGNFLLTAISNVGKVPKQIFGEKGEFCLSPWERR
jgi:hypothetical protein